MNRSGFFLVSQTWLPTVEDVLQADLQGVWHSWQALAALSSILMVFVASTLMNFTALLPSQTKICPHNIYDKQLKSRGSP
jgi:hypothetical protein